MSCKVRSENYKLSYTLACAHLSLYVAGIKSIISAVTDCINTTLNSVFATKQSGGYCCGVPPLPIPNREVKPACADGTAMQCGRVGRRPLYIEVSL